MLILSNQICPPCGIRFHWIIGKDGEGLQVPVGFNARYAEILFCPQCKTVLWLEKDIETPYSYAIVKDVDLFQQYPRLKEKSRDLWLAIWQEFDRQKPPMTVRQMFYRMSSQGHVEKTENGYRRVQHALSEMRRASAIPYSHIADNTRWVRKPRSFANLIDAMENMQKLYRREIWSRQSAYIEVWLEKDALAGVLYDITEEYDVPLYVTRGYASMSYLYEAAQSLKEINKPVFIYHFGDYDASGQDAARSIRDGLRSFGVDFEFIQAAVLPDQISQFNLQTRPAKASDPRARKHGKLAVELDAIEPAQLRSMVRDIIERHIDRAELARMQQIQEAERSTIEDMISAFRQHEAPNIDDIMNLF